MRFDSVWFALMFVFVLWFGCCSRFCLGLGFTAVTGVASDMHFPVGEVRVNLLSHDDHLAGNVLVRVVVAGEVAFDVAKIAFNAESGAERAHDGDQLRSWDFQNLQILWLGHWAVRLWGVRRRLLCP